MTPNTKEDYKNSLELSNMLINTYEEFKVLRVKHFNIIITNDKNERYEIKKWNDNKKKFYENIDILKNSNHIWKSIEITYEHHKRLLENFY